jgi:nitroreductase
MVIIANIDRASAARALSAAAASALLAPSIHNTQPWRWQIRGGVGELYADTHRQLPIADPDGRLMMLSCGAALHHACVALAAEGIAIDVVRTDEDRNGDHPDSLGESNHLARLSVTGRVPVTDAAMRMFQTISIRHTDRRPLLEQRLPASAIDALRATAAPFGIGLHQLERNQVIELAGATFLAQTGELDDAAARAEINAWTDPHRPTDAGVPATNIPDATAPTTVPMRDFGHVGALPIPGGHDNAATYVILYGLADEPRSWLRAGEALSAIWLTATEDMVALLPMSAVVEVPATRQILHRMLSGLGYPYLTLRLGVADPQQPTVAATPRLPAEANIEVLP